VSTLRLPGSRLFGFSRPILLHQLPNVSPLSVCAKHLFILRHVVEQRKTRLTTKLVLRSNVDWLSEAIRRFSEAHALGRDFSTVTMSDVFRYEKVRGRLHLFPRSPLTLMLRCFSGRPQKHAMLTASGTTTRWLHLRMPFLPTVLSYGLSAMKLAHARSMRSCAITGTGKSTVSSLFPLF
jgi:hypothetical protein